MTVDLKDIDNAVHKALSKNCDDRVALAREVGKLYTQYGRERVTDSLISCTQIAYLRLRFAEGHSDQ